MKFLFLVLLIALLPIGCNMMDAPADRNRAGEMGADASLDVFEPDAQSSGARHACESDSDCPAPWHENANSVSCGNDGFCKVICASDFSHCESNLDHPSYCNTDKRSDPDNCGGCAGGKGIKCSGSTDRNFLRTCENSECGIDRKQCEPGFRNINTDSSNADANCQEEE